MNRGDYDHDPLGDGCGCACWLILGAVIWLLLLLARAAWIVVWG